ncbi:MAG: GTP-binding protein [Arachnia sp.]
MEASGVAEPLALARLVRFSGVERVRLGGVVEVVDATEVFRTVDIGPEPPLRYAAATLVVIGKADLLPDGDRVVERIRARVLRRNSGAHIVVARRGRIDPALVFDVAGDDDQLPIAEALRAEGGGHHRHAQAASVRLDGRVSPTALVALLEDPPPGAYRLKGRVAVRVPRGERGFVVNVVGRSLHVAPLEPPPATGELVAVGLELDREEADRRLRLVADAPVDRVDAPGLRALRRYRRLSD